MKFCINMEKVLKQFSHVSNIDHMIYLQLDLVAVEKLVKKMFACDLSNNHTRFQS